MNEWESSQTSNRLELMMKKNIGHAQSFSPFLSVSLFLFSRVSSLFLFSYSIVIKRVYHATIVSRSWLTSNVFFFFIQSDFFWIHQEKRKKKGIFSFYKPIKLKMKINQSKYKMLSTYITIIEVHLMHWKLFARIID